MQTQKLIIMIGNIASGKTMFIRKYLLRKENKDTVCLSKDAMRWCIGDGNKYKWAPETEFRIHEDILTQIANYLLDGFSVVYDETNMNADTRKPFIDLAQNVFAKNPVNLRRDIKAVVMPRTTVDEAIRRRCGNSHEAWGVPEEIWRNVWYRKQNLYEPPVYTEGFTNIVAAEGF